MASARSKTTVSYELTLSKEEAEYLAWFMEMVPNWMEGEGEIAENISIALNMAGVQFVRSQFKIVSGCDEADVIVERLGGK